MSERTIDAIFFNLDETETAKAVDLINRECDSNVRADYITNKGDLALGKRSDLNVTFFVTWPKHFPGARYRADQICVKVTRETGYVHNLPPKALI